MVFAKDGLSTKEETGIVDGTDFFKPGNARTAPIASKLDLSAKLNQASILPHVHRVARGKRLDAPLVVDLDPTSFCDLACPECISSGVLNKGQFPPKRLEALAEEIVEAGVKGVILIGGGEPLLHKSIGRVIAALHDGGVQLGMVTNGTLIDRYLDVLGQRMSWVRVSVDAASTETYDRFRPSGRPISVFPQVIGNMEKLASVKRGRLGYSFLLMQRRDGEGRVVDSNYNEVYAAGRLAKSIGCDYLEIKAAFDDGHFLITENEQDIARVEQQLGRLAELEDENFRILRSSTWEALRRGSDREQIKNYSSCGIAELRTTITPSGVYSCAYHRGSEKGRIGSVLNTPLREMWAQADTQRIDPSQDCRFHCARHISNEFIGKLADGASPSAVDDYDFFI